MAALQLAQTRARTAEESLRALEQAVRGRGAGEALSSATDNLQPVFDGLRKIHESEARSWKQEVGEQPGLEREEEAQRGSRDRACSEAGIQKGEGNSIAWVEQVCDNSRGDNSRGDDGSSENVGRGRPGGWSLNPCRAELPGTGDRFPSSGAGRWPADVDELREGLRKATELATWQKQRDQGGWRDHWEDEEPREPWEGPLQRTQDHSVTINVAGLGVTSLLPSVPPSLPPSVPPSVAPTVPRPIPPPQLQSPPADLSSGHLTLRLRPGRLSALSRVHALAPGFNPYHHARPCYAYHRPAFHTAPSPLPSHATLMSLNALTAPLPVLANSATSSSSAASGFSSPIPSTSVPKCFPDIVAGSPFSAAPTAPSAVFAAPATDAEAFPANASAAQPAGRSLTFPASPALSSTSSSSHTFHSSLSHSSTVVPSSSSLSSSSIPFVTPCSSCTSSIQFHSGLTYQCHQPSQAASSTPHRKSVWRSCASQHPSLLSSLLNALSRFVRRSLVLPQLLLRIHYSFLIPHLLGYTFKQFYASQSCELEESLYELRGNVCDEAGELPLANKRGGIMSSPRDWEEIGVLEDEDSWSIAWLVQVVLAMEGDG
ncbi:hypothetical protein CLOM_g16505 [Closterium sp. NIES-68]|nr:hypothetical protein CLOM_g16505 [Closterium sp. NIES-68]GJP66152.1 hypothetical protein CLOP_g23059 [Closterium sp. NIES-67]